MATAVQKQKVRIAALRAFEENVGSEEVSLKLKEAETDDVVYEEVRDLELDQLDVDSLAKLEIVLACEQGLEIETDTQDEDKLKGSKTIGDFIDILEKIYKLDT
jgi:acyl carrier protein